MSRLFKCNGLINLAVNTVLFSTAFHGNIVHASPILYTLTTLLPGMTAWAMNEHGQVAGWSDTDYFARIYTPGVGIREIPLPEGGRAAVGYSINEAGQVAGRLYGPPNYGPNGYVNWGFIYTPGATPAVRTIVGDVGFNYVLNDAGAIVRLTSPAPAYSTEAIVTSVNANYSTGYSRFVGDRDYGQAWRYNPDGSFTDLSPLLGSLESQAYGVNSSGTVVGRRLPSGGLTTAFAYSDSMGAVNLFDVTDPASRAGWSTFISAQDITEDGRIVGYGFRDGPWISGFILTPVNAVPEPGTASLWLAAMFGFFLIRRRR
jgi:uncharacterized membrane protein